MMFFGTLFFSLIFGFSSISLAHKGLHQEETKKQVTTQDSVNELGIRLETINESYNRGVKQIFQRTCFDCHSQSPNLPWYNSLPLVRTLLDNDMKEAKEHLDFTNGFPFKGHGSPKEDLEAISESIEDKSMPPFRYRAMHWRSGLSDEERKIILKWTRDSQNLLGQSQDQKGQLGGK